ncbi:acid protease [Metschnikowia bicuspidata var. bicuspidata NRRL YB-4993]|uniref:Acid protease n=1 Tax=Metschnikowia bicuspidata var. bicuspidata NRRL YB-4993 TaxID=869754 RepID=A0A1A0HBE6_9ASCO|nr:acid protease [Metschnikowia bicuspidata var. bicuspidata NRRL YB-4993]OBA21310.1 acid protease [Metschnikowia bicuspidata var. bicuspidata NRRL YB-4993]
MTRLLSLLCLSASVFGYSISEIEKPEAPAPLKFDFSIEKKIGDLSARDFWTQNGKRKNKRDEVAVLIHNVQDIYYMLNVYLGSNKQSNYVVIDTGSSDLWVPSSGYDAKTSTTSEDTDIPFGIMYIDGSVAQGEYYKDSFLFGTSESILDSFQFALSNASGPGILGIGNKAQEVATLKYDNFPWALQNAGITPKASYSLYLNPNSDSGVVIFGGIDTEKYDGCLSKYPVYDSGNDLSINVESVYMGEKEIEINSPYSIDSGTSLGLVGQELMDELDIIFDATVVEMDGTSYRVISCTQPDDQYVVFNFGANEILISYADLVLKNDDDSCILGLAYFEGYQVLGDVFMKHAYVYFDLTDQTIALAQAVSSEKSNIITA